MSTDKSTLGPWEIVKYSEHCKIVWNGYCIATVPGYVGFVDNAVANAHLISAAPDILEALRWYVKTDEVTDTPENEFWLEGKKRALAAIAKATDNKL